MPIPNLPEFQEVLLGMRLATAKPSAPDTLTNWLHELDYLAKGMIAGKQPTESQFAEAFIA